MNILCFYTCVAILEYVILCSTLIMGEYSDVFMLDWWSFLFESDGKK